MNKKDKFIQKAIKFGGVYECYEIELPINEIVSYE